MPIGDKIEAAKKIGEFLQAAVKNSGLRLKYRITVDPPCLKTATGSIQKFSW